MLALSKVPDPERFGVPVFNEHNELIDVVEKPKNPANDFAVTGVYLYGPKLFFEAFTHIQKSLRGEYEISDIHSYLLKTQKKVGHKEITGWWKDTGKTEDLILANKLILDNMLESDFQKLGMIHENAQIFGSLSTGFATEILDGVTIRGPVILGENCILKNCTLGPYVTVASGACIQDCTIENSIILQNASIEAPMKIVDSLIGKDVKLVKRQNTELQGHKMVIGDNTFIEI
jgi:glucose-1-phosphate thymidylyltransferase